MHRVMDEIDTYYELTYIPRVDKYDGKFRHIAVKVANNDLTVQSRAGYFALPPDMLRTSGVNAYEVPLLHTLTDMRANRALPFESGGMHFRGDGNLETCGVLIDMPLSNVTLREERGKDKIDGRLCLPGPDQRCQRRGGEEAARRDAARADQGSSVVAQAEPLHGRGIR